MTFLLKDEDNGNTKQFDSRAKAKEKKVELEGLGSNITIEQIGVEDVNAEVIDMSEQNGGNNTDNDDDDEPTMGIDVCVHCGNDIEDGHCPDCDEADGNQLPDDSDKTEVIEESVNAIETVKDGGLDTDPLNVLPDFMTDIIQGSEAVNKRGYAMIAERYDIEVSTEMIESPWDNEEGRVVCKATAVTDAGKTYNAYGTACADDGDDSKNLIELADTRSQKRAVQWASGFGIVGYQELTGQLEEES